MPKPKRRSKKRERGFLTELRHSFEENGAFFFKIADMPHFAGSRHRFDLEKPFDAFLCYKGKPIAIEAKTLTSYSAFGSQIRGSQIKGLDAFVKAGGRGFIFLNIRTKKPYMNRLIIFDWEEYGERFKSGWTMKKKELLCQQFRQGKKKRFLLRLWLTSLTTRRR